VATSASALGSLVGAMPQVQEIVASLKQGEEIAQFLRQQTEFWMEQVRLIERAHSQGGSGASASAATPTWPGLPPGMNAALLTGVATGTTASGSASVATAAVPVAPAPAAAPAAPSAPVSPNKEEAPTSPVTPKGVDTEGRTLSGGSDLGAQMSELQRLQKERWLKRSSSNVSAGEEQAGSSTQ